MCKDLLITGTGAHTRTGLTRKKKISLVLYVKAKRELYFKVLLFSKSRHFLSYNIHFAP